MWGVFSQYLWKNERQRVTPEGLALQDFFKYETEPPTSTSALLRERPVSKHVDG